MNKKAFTVISLVMLFSTVVVSQLRNSANGNPNWRPWENIIPHSEPEIIIESPVQGETYSENGVWLNFTVTKPSDWVELEGHLTSIIYYIDSINIYSSIDQNYSETEIAVEDPLGVVDSPLEFIFSFKLAGLSEGRHSIVIMARGLLKDQGDEIPVHGYSGTIYFAVDGNAPVISNLSVENKTYSQNDLPLNFTVDESTSWLVYNLDNQANVTIVDEAFLRDLPIGSHNVTVYAEDAFGHMGASETIFFTVAEPFPTLLVATAIPVAVVLVGLCLLLCLIKRK